MANVINVDPVAWSIDGGRHPGDLLRVLAYAATQGSEGVIAPGDCRVRQLSTGAGPQVRIDSGAVAVRNRSANIDNQTYIANNRAESRLDIDPTTGSARSDLVVMRIRDPQFAPWQSVVGAADPKTFQYAELLVIKGVPAGTTTFTQLNLGYSAYALARIDLPAGTTNVSDSMIKTLRSVAVQRRKPFFQRIDFPTGSTTEYSSTTTTDFRKFPNTVADFSVPVPDFATRCIVRAGITGLSHYDGSYRGEWHIQFNKSGETSFATKVIYANEITPSDQRLSYDIRDDIAIPAEYRGQTSNVQLEFRRIAGTGRWRADENTQIYLDLDFYGSAI